MQAVVLCGGEGSRLFPMTQWTPEPLLPVRGVPILVHILRSLRDAGISEAIVCASDAARDQFEYHAAVVRDLTFKVTLCTHPRTEELGNAWGVMAASRFLVGDFLVYFGDILCRTNLRGMLEAWAEKDGSAAAMLATSPLLRTDKGVVTLEGTKVTALMEKPLVNLPNLVGIDIFRRDTLPLFDPTADLHRDVVGRLISEARPVFSWHVDDYLDIGSVDAYRRAQTW